ncbi:hypothetical protein [Thermococcus sp.]
MNIWDTIKEQFKEQPAKMKVVKYLFVHGFGITEKGKIRCGKIEIPRNNVAKTLNVSPTTISQTIKTILQNPKLRMIFLNLEPLSSLSKSARYLGYDSLKITLKDRDAHTLSKLISKLAEGDARVVQLFIYPSPYGGLEMIVVSTQKPLAPSP